MNWFSLVRLAVLLLSFTPAPLGAAAVLSESPTTVAPGETVVATWSGVDTPSRLDWFGFDHQVPALNVAGLTQASPQTGQPGDVGLRRAAV